MILRGLCEYKHVEIIEGLMPDHIHLAPQHTAIAGSGRPIENRSKVCYNKGISHKERSL